MTKIVLAAMLALVTAVSCWAADGVGVCKYTGHVYLIVKKAATWQSADTDARRAHGHLAIITSAGENSYLFGKLMAAGITTTAPDGGGARYVWLGGSDIAKEGEWRWSDGVLISTGYSNWGHGGEPDNYRDMQDCLAMGLQAWPVGSGRMGSPSEWNDISGKNRLAYIIEFDSDKSDADGDGTPDWQEYLAGHKDH